MIVYLFIFFDDSYFDLIPGQRCPSLKLGIFKSLICVNYLLKGDLPPIFLVCCKWISVVTIITVLS